MKRIFFSCIVFVTLFTNLIYANIDAEIDAIKHASVKERFKLMNAFKKNLIKMKEEERIKAMTKLTIQSKNKHAKKALDELKQHAKRKNIQNHIEYHAIDEDNIVNETDDQG
ncbi:hypothetical protein C9926_01770, partial [Sulfurovum lithotrophicum]